MPDDKSSNSLEDTMPQVEPPEPMKPAARIIGERYVVEKEVGRGGVGEVYFARHRYTSQPVAIKTLRSKWADNDSAIARFEREAKALSQLQHPNCVSVLDFGREESTQDWYLAMEWVEGEDFKKVIKTGGALSRPDWLNYFKQALKALRYIHSQGLLHRDIKPKNLMLTEKKGASGVVKLVDFGFVKFSGDDPKDTGGKTLTKPGTVLGTPEYMAPEQAKGEVIDERADLFAISSVMLFCLTGRSFYRGDGIRETLKNIILKELPHINNLLPPEQGAEELNTFLHRSMAKKREDRYQSAQEMLDALDQLPWAKKELKNIMNFTDPTSHLLHSEFSKEQTSNTSQLSRPSKKEDPSLSESSVPQKNSFVFLWVTLLALMVVFMWVGWFFWVPSEAVEKAPLEAQVIAPQAMTEQRIEEMLQAGQTAMASQDFKTAFGHFEKLMKADIKSRAVLTGMALSAFHLKNFDAAADAFHQLSEAYPEEAGRYKPFIDLAESKAKKATKR